LYGEGDLLVGEVAAKKSVVTAGINSKNVDLFIVDELIARCLNTPAPAFS
jgi:hypothetical protein